MKKQKNNDGITPWKIDHPMERWLGRMADKSEWGKVLYVKFYEFFDRDYYNKGLKFIDRNIGQFVGEVTEEQRKQYIYDMVYSLHRFGCMFDEYFLYAYPNLNVHGRESFITDKIRWDYYSRMNQDENKELFNNKRKAYEIFRKYYNRELIEVVGDADRDVFFDFLSRHERFIVKPVYGSGGKGIHVEDLHLHANSESLFRELYKNGPVVVEELIQQSESMAVLHPASINTVRVCTIKLKDRVVIFRPFLRMGLGASIVDNAARGGIFVAVDAETGICVGEGVDEFGNRYMIHPETKIVLPGFQIPRWDEAVRFVTELSNVVEDNHYTGWDIALTDEGWTMVEGNPRGQFVIQIATREGVKEEIENYIRQM